MDTAVSRVKKCVSDIRSWMITNQLMVNDNKTEITSPHFSFYSWLTTFITSCWRRWCRTINFCLRSGCRHRRTCNYESACEHSLLQRFIYSIQHWQIQNLGYLDQASTENLVHAFWDSTHAKLDVFWIILFWLIVVAHSFMSSAGGFPLAHALLCLFFQSRCVFPFSLLSTPWWHHWLSDLICFINFCWYFNLPCIVNWSCRFYTVSCLRLNLCNLRGYCTYYPKLACFCALSQNYQHTFFKKKNDTCILM